MGKWSMEYHTSFPVKQQGLKDMQIRRREQVGSAFFLLFGLIICVASFKLSIGSLGRPEAGFFPFWAGVALSALSLLNLIGAMAKRKERDELTEPESSPINWKNIGLTLAVLFAYPYFMTLVGFLPVTFLFFIIMLRFIEPKRWAIVLGGGFAATIFCYLLFQYWLKIQFPKGILGI